MGIFKSLASRMIGKKYWLWQARSFSLILDIWSLNLLEGQIRDGELKTPPAEAPIVIFKWVWKVANLLSLDLQNHIIYSILQIETKKKFYQTTFFKTLKGYKDKKQKWNKDLFVYPECIMTQLGQATFCKVTSIWQ